MANQLVTDLGEITTLPDSGIIHVVDTTDNTQEVAGSSFKITKADLLKENTAAILLNTAKIGVTLEQATAITNNTNKVGYTDDLVAAAPTVVANTEKIGITTAQSLAIVDNTAFTKLNDFKVQSLEDRNDGATNSLAASLNYGFTIAAVSEINLAASYTLENVGDKVSFFGKVIADYSQTAFYTNFIGKKLDFANSFGFINNATNTNYNLRLRVDGDALAVVFDMSSVSLLIDSLIELVRNSATSYSVFVNGVLIDTKTVAGTGKLIINNIGNARGGTVDRGTNATIEYFNITLSGITNYFKKLSVTTDSRFTPSNIFKNRVSALSFADGTIADSKLINVEAIVLDPVLLNENFNERSLTPTYFPTFVNPSTSGANCTITANVATAYGNETVHRLTLKNNSFALPFLTANVTTIRDSKSTVFSFWKDCFFDDLAVNKISSIFYGYQATSIAIPYELTNGYKKTTTSTKTASNGTSYTMVAEALVNNEVFVGTRRFIHVSFLIKTTYTGSINLDTSLTLQVLGGAVPFAGNYFYDFHNIIVAKSAYHIASNIVPSASVKGNVFAQLELVNQSEIVQDYRLGVAGDSIVFGDSASAISAADSNYYPQDGVGSFKNYIFQIAKDQKLKWFNYGVNGSTLGNMTVQGVNRNGFSNTRYTAMNANLKTIVLAFGFNDNAQGFRAKIEAYILATFGETRYYTTTPALYNTNSGDGVFFLTAAQNTSLENAASPSSVNTFFTNQYIGAITDTTNTTFYGAFNIVMEYLILNYPQAKLGIVCPYGAKAGFTTACKDISKKFGLVSPFDFDSNIETPLFYSRQAGDPSANTTINGVNLATYRRSVYLSDGTHPNDFGYEFLAKTLGQWVKGL